MGATTNYAFPFPESTDHTRTWEHWEALAQAIDDFFLSDVLVAYGSWTPAWTASGTAPNIGNAVRVGRYVQLGKRVHAQFTITFGTTSTFGTGTYAFSLPVPAASNAKAVGSAYLRDSSAAANGHFAGAVVIDPVVSTSTAFLTNVNAVVGQTVPFIWDDPDSLSGTIAYEAA